MNYKDPHKKEQVDGDLHPVHPAVESYLMNLSRGQDETILLAMEKLAMERSFPIVGRLVGAFLEVLALCLGAKRVFELGSGFGFSAYWWTRAVESAGGEVICTDGDAENKKRAEEYLKQVNRWDCVDYHVGWAQEVFRQTQGSFDIVYNDVDKGDYPEVWTLVKERIRPGGLYVCDNTLWFGRVTQEKVVKDHSPGWTAAIKYHNEMIAQDPEFDFFMNPIRDGVMVARRKSH